RSPSSASHSSARAAPPSRSTAVPSTCLQSPLDPLFYPKAVSKEIGCYIHRRSVAPAAPEPDQYTARLLFEDECDLPVPSIWVVPDGVAVDEEPDAVGRNGDVADPWGNSFV